MTIWRCSVSWPWPTKSASVRGRSPASSISSAGTATGSTGRGAPGRRRVPPEGTSWRPVGSVRSVGRGSDRTSRLAWGVIGCGPARAGPPAPAPRPMRRRPSRRGRYGSRRGHSPARTSAARASARADPVAGADGPLPVQRREVQPGLELQQQAGGRLLAHARHRAEGVDVLFEHGRGQGGRRHRREDAEGQRGADAVGTEQRFEAPALVGVGEAVQHDGILADMGVHMEEHLVARGPEGGQQRGRHRCPVADAGHLDDDLAGCRAVDQHAAQGSDHRCSPVAAATARRSGCAVRWHAASARASATSGGRGASARPRTDATIRCTCSLVAPP